jgi:hypothetical protein
MAHRFDAGRAEKAKLAVAVVTVVVLAFVLTLTVEGNSLISSGGGRGGSRSMTVASLPVWKDSGESRGAGISIFLVNLDAR